MEFLEKVRRELSVRKYSPKTMQSYLFCLKKYFEYKKDNIGKFDEESVKNYLYQLAKRNISASSINQHINAIQFFYREIQKVPQKVHFRFSKKPQKLPIVLTHSEITRGIDSLSNPKHKYILSLAYASGL